MQSKQEFSSSCPRCEIGSVKMLIVKTHGRFNGPAEDCYPDGYAATVGACNECGASDWTEEEFENINENETGGETVDDGECGQFDTIYERDHD